MNKEINNGSSIQDTLFGDEKKNIIIRKHTSLEKKVLEKEENKPWGIYDKPPCKLNEHFWRDAYLKTSVRTRHIIYCTYCIRIKFNIDGKTVEQWLLDQGYIKAKDGSDEQVTDFGYGH